jgi:hypothetical protein
MDQNDRKPDSFGGGGDSQFNSSGFGNSTFGGQGNAAMNQNSSFGSANNSKFGGQSEFGSAQFGGNSSVSQIFKEGAFGEDDRRRRMVVVGAALAAICVIGAAVYFLFVPDHSVPSIDGAIATDESVPAQEFAPPPADQPVDAQAPADAAAAPAAGAATGATVGDDVVPDGAAAPAGASASVTGNVTNWEYDETKGGPVVKVADGAMVEVSRSFSFAGKYVYGPAKGGSFRIPNPPPGAIYWREQGSGTVNEIKVTAPRSLGISFSAPATMTPGGTLSWSSSVPASYYRVEFSTDSGFLDIAAAVSTTNTETVINGLNPGTYFVRVGGLNTAAGRFEYSKGAAVNMQ